MTMEYIREHYDSRFRRGARVVVRWHGRVYAGRIVGSYGAYLRISIGANPREKALIFHPSDVNILPDETTPEVQP